MYCVLAALGYGGVNVCLRVLTVRCDHGLILLIKEIMALSFVGLWVASRARRDGFRVPGRSTVVGLMVIGALTQLAGTLPLLWSMAVVGLAIAVTASLCASLVTSAALGQWVLGERVSLQSLSAIGLLVGAVGFLTFGAQGSPDSSAFVDEHGPLVVLSGTAAACLAGVIYGVLNVGVRRCVTNGVSVAFVALVIPFMGVICLSPLCLWRLAASGIPSIPAEDLVVLIVGGMLNVAAWFAYIKGLQTTPVVHANVLTTSQVAMAAVAGVFLFGEAVSPALIAGIVMTIAGMVWIDRPAP
jgi:drug/metabolite transporter (DMT)-like permease